MSLPDDQQLLDDINHAPGAWKTLRSLQGLYGLKGPQRLALRRMVRRLVAEGRLVRLRGIQRYGLPRTRETVAGTLTGNPRGFGFVAPEDPGLPDVFIREGHLGGALHGDRVEVALLPGADPDRPAGEIVAVVERRTERIVGVLRRHGRGPHALRPFDLRITAEIVVPERFAGGAEDGVFVDTVLLRDSRSGARSGSLQARVTAVLGRADDPGTDERVILASYRLSDAHSPQAVLEAERVAKAGIPEAERARRRDLRSLLTVTIDGETARDFDDAVSVERRGAHARLWVHVADVAAHVEEGSALDAEALERATSVYFPGRALHMLPEALSAGACSLVPGEDRMAKTVVLDVDAQGRVVATEACESLIRSDRRLTYTEVKRLLVDGDEPARRELGPVGPALELMADVASRLQRAREARGGLDFDLPVPMLTLDEEGMVVDVVPSERNVAHRIIEEFMIAANSAVARELTSAGVATLHRNHEPPALERVEAFRDACAALGVPFEPRPGEAVRPGDFQRALAGARGRPEERFLVMLALRTMSLARYEPAPVGHFGLALEHYAHFTSPIRRYPDLVVHRALARLLAARGSSPGQAADEDGDEAAADLAELGEHCSRCERNAEAAERALVEWKKVAFVRERVGEEFAARVTGVAEAGVFVVLDDHLVEGFARYQDLVADTYDRDDSGLRAVGRRTGRSLRLGDALRVRITEVDLFRRRVSLEEA